MSSERLDRNIAFSVFLIAGLIESVGRIIQPLVVKHLLGFEKLSLVHYPLNYYTLQSRLGLFIVMILGEFLLGIASQEMYGSSVQRAYSYLFCVVTIAFSLVELSLSLFPLFSPTFTNLLPL